MCRIGILKVEPLLKKNRRILVLALKLYFMTSFLVLLSYALWLAIIIATVQWVNKRIIPCQNIHILLLHLSESELQKLQHPKKSEEIPDEENIAI